MFRLFKQSSMAFFFICIFGCCSFSTPIQAATLHAILVGDTNDLSLGRAMRININSIYKELEIAAEKTDLELNPIVAYGKLTNRKQVLEEIENLNVEPNDVVIAYFSMHGYRTDHNQTIWPNLFFGEEHNGIDMDYIIASLREKNPRLLIALADSCNKYLNSSIDTMYAPTALGWTDFFFADQQKNYKKLFLDSSGIIIASATEPGTVAWGVNKVGSFMTMSFVESLHDVVGRTKNVSWEEVFSQLEIRVGSYLKKYKSKNIQIPQYVIDLH